MIFHVAAIAAVLLAGFFVFGTEASSRAKGIIAVVIVASILAQHAVGASWALATGIVVQALVSVGIAFYLKFSY